MYRTSIFVSLFFVSSITALFSQSKDSLSNHDAFFENIEPSFADNKNVLLKDINQRTFLTEFQNKFTADFDTKIQYQKITQENNGDKWEIGLYNARKQQADFYKNYPNYAQFSDNFKTWIEANIRYNYWHLLLAFPIQRANADPASLKIYALPNVMIEGLDLATISNEKLLVSESYRHFLYYFVTYFNSMNHRFEKYKDQSAAMTDKATFSAKYLKGTVEKYYLTRLILQNCNFTPAVGIKQTIALLATLPQSEKYVKLAMSNCNEAINRKEIPKPVEVNSADIFDKELVGMNDNTFNTSAFKGKYVYVDFWASWCGPCRQEFPYSKEMQARFTEKQKKKIVFLNISIDEKKANWQKAVEDLKLEGENGWSPEIATKMKINSIPRYMIIDKDGKIMNLNSSRPSNPDTYNQLLELIEK